jgi:sporulation protein YlmC with PRC-barrel domain
VVDRKKRRMGKVDGVVMVLRKEKPPRLAYIEMGMSTLAHRLHPRLGRWAESIGRRWGIRRGKPFRIQWSKVRDVGIDVDVDLDAEETPVLDWEKWLNKQIVERIPGSG